MESEHLLTPKEWSWWFYLSALRLLWIRFLNFGCCAKCHRFQFVGIMNIINFFVSNFFAMQESVDNFDRKRLDEFIERKNIFIAGDTLIGTIRMGLKWLLAGRAVRIVLSVPKNSIFKNQFVSIFQIQDNI